jgi:ketosteroid isomerase-like protein
VSEREAKRIRRLFGLLDRGAFDEFLSNCTEDLTLTVRGSAPATTTVARSDIPEWYRSVQAMVDVDFRSTVSLVLNKGKESIVVLRHAFERDGVTREYETVNVCTLSGNLLARWSSSPVSLQEYADAWAVGGESQLQPVRAEGVRARSN